MAHIPHVIKLQAEDLYVVDSLSVPEIAAKTGLNTSTLYTWCTKEEWQKKRAIYKDQLNSIRKNTRRIRFELSKKAANTLDPQDIYAFERMEKLARRYNDDVDEDGSPENVTEDSLKEAAVKALNRLSKGKNVKITEIQKALEIAERLHEKENQTQKNTARPKGADKRAIEAIKREVLGQ